MPAASRTVLPPAREPSAAGVLLRGVIVGFVVVLSLALVVGGLVQLLS